MKNFLQNLLKQLVDHPDEVNVSESTHDHEVILTAQVASEDMGKVIGRQGKIIKAIRDLTKIIAVKEQRSVTIELAEPTGQKEPTSQQE